MMREQKSYALALYTLSHALQQRPRQNPNINSNAERHIGNNGMQEKDRMTGEARSPLSDGDTRERGAKSAPMEGSARTFAQE
jgi:hypothetical protein